MIKLNKKKEINTHEFMKIEYEIFYSDAFF